MRLFGTFRRRNRQFLMVLNLCTLSILSAPVAGQESEDRTDISPLVVFTVVATDTREPVTGALLEIPAVSLAGITDSLGHVSFRAVKAGSYRFVIRHLAYAPAEDSISIQGGEATEYRIQLAPQAIAVEPLTVEITGRDPYLVDVGFYDREKSVESGYFATVKEIQSYRMFDHLFEFQTDLSVRLGRNPVIFVDGLPADRLGFRTLDDLNDIPFDRVRGIEAYPCNEAPPEIMRWFPPHADITNCNLIAVWRR